MKTIHHDNLVDAAEDLLDALKRIRRWFDNQPGTKLEDLPYEFIDAAIAKAEGTQHNSK